MNQQIINALQRVHELTQQNCPESAGAAWADFIENVILISVNADDAGIVLDENEYTDIVQRALQSTGMGEIPS